MAWRGRRWLASSVIRAGVDRGPPAWRCRSPSRRVRVRPGRDQLQPTRRCCCGEGEGRGRDRDGSTTGNQVARSRSASHGERPVLPGWQLAAYSRAQPCELAHLVVALPACCYVPGDPLGFLAVEPGLEGQGVRVVAEPTNRWHCTAPHGETGQPVAERQGWSLPSDRARRRRAAWRRDITVPAGIPREAAISA